MGSILGVLGRVRRVAVSIKEFFCSLQRELVKKVGLAPYFTAFARSLIIDSQDRLRGVGGSLGPILKGGGGKGKERVWQTEWPSTADGM